MGAKDFLTLSSAKSLAAYKDILEHSHSKWRTAILVANAEDYGTAMSTAIVSVEELVKALIVAMNGYGFEFRKVPTMQRFFRNHQIRYLLAYAMFLTSVFTHELTEWILKLNDYTGII